jgi:SAM-dependent methyltransferase
VHCSDIGYVLTSSVKAVGESAAVSIVDAKYYEAVPPKSIAERLFISARDQIYADLMTRMRPGPTDRILDVGVSDFINDASNVLERRYPYRENITACGIGDPKAFRSAYGEVRYVGIEPNRPLPFEDATFDIGVSNAVLEHVGSLEAQLAFVRELCRVSKRVYITVPHRFFPVEHHTALPLVHYLDGSFRLALRVVRNQKWAKEENLILMTRKRLWRLAEGIDRSVAVGYTGLKLGPFSSNLFLAIS